MARNDDDRTTLVFIERGTRGLTLIDDWTSFGQRTTGSGTTKFDHIPVTAFQVVPHQDVFDRPTPMGPVAQIIHAAVDLGIARAALADTISFHQAFRAAVVRDEIRARIGRSPCRRRRRRSCDPRPWSGSAAHARRPLRRPRFGESDRRHRRRSLYCRRRSQGAFDRGLASCLEQAVRTDRVTLHASGESISIAIGGTPARTPSTIRSATNTSMSATTSSTESSRSATEHREGRGGGKTRLKKRYEAGNDASARRPDRPSAMSLMPRRAKTARNVDRTLGSRQSPTRTGESGYRPVRDTNRADRLRSRNSMRRLA